jgi:5-methyltetrahydropteroyltriglutamate--homocysteine methyltransferase
VFLECTGPISYRGQEALQPDIENLKAAIDEAGAQEAFLPAVAPSGRGRERVLQNRGRVLAGHRRRNARRIPGHRGRRVLVQIDDPFLAEWFRSVTLQPATRNDARPA